jgi:hypothetical protein
LTKLISIRNPNAENRRQKQQEDDERPHGNQSSRAESTVQSPSDMNENLRIRKPSKSYQVYDIFPKNDSASIASPYVRSESSILVTIYNNTNAKRTSNVRTPNMDQSFEMKNVWIQPQTHEEIVDSTSTDRHVTSETCSTNKISNFTGANVSMNINRSLSDQDRLELSSPVTFQSDHCNSLQSPLTHKSKIGRPQSLAGSAIDFGQLARKYILGNGHQTKVSNV